MSKKAIVIQDFRDKNTDEYHRVGSVYISEDTKRIDEIKKKGYIEIVEVDKEQTESTTGKEEPQKSGE